MYDNYYKKPLTQIEENYLRKIQDEIMYCYNCQPYDSGEPIWIYGDKTEIEDLLCKFNVPEKYWKNIIDHLSCPCGTKVEYGGDVGVKTKYEKDIETFIDNSNKRFVNQIQLFVEFLMKNPLLGYKHSIGKRLYNELKNQQFPIITLTSESIFFRSRKVSNHNIIQSYQMLNAPVGRSTEGRFNHAGQSHLYLANTEETAVREVVQNFNNSLVWIQKFEISDNVDNILDLTFDITNLDLNTNSLLLSLSLTKSLEESINNVEYWRPDYFLTRFIMDCSKELNYNGIKYNSSRNSKDFNVVLFYPENFKLKNIENPKIHFFNNTENDIFDD